MVSTPNPTNERRASPLHRCKWCGAVFPSAASLRSHQNVAHYFNSSGYESREQSSLNEESTNQQPHQGTGETVGGDVEDLRERQPAADPGPVATETDGGVGREEDPSLPDPSPRQVVARPSPLDMQRPRALDREWMDTEFWEFVRSNRRQGPRGAPVSSRDTD
jgi:hypothetical protein